MAILYMVDYITLRIGVPMYDGSFRATPHDDIAQMMDNIVGAPRFTKSVVEGKESARKPNRRYYKCVKTLIKAGAFETHKVWKKYTTETGEELTRALVGIKKVSEHFIVAISGMSYNRFRKFRAERGDKQKNRQFQHAYGDGKERRSDRDTAQGNLKSAINLRKVSRAVKDKKQRQQAVLKGVERPRSPDKQNVDAELTQKRNAFALELMQSGVTDQKVIWEAVNARHPTSGSEDDPSK